MECEQLFILVHMGCARRLELPIRLSASLGSQPSALPIKLRTHGDSTQTRTGNPEGNVPHLQCGALPIWLCCHLKHNHSFFPHNLPEFQMLIVFLGH